ncbi:hypothetical protein FKW77_009826 [Venturia effusa]|uniref:Uncharacterized protein n=1 Tax=Venturia effusa TaxID=50376 RepID=A0A517LBR0_9PEZI|nr:hypothetical protein FKW77_009826 [Venturia effusa]
MAYCHPGLQLIYKSVPSLHLHLALLENSPAMSQYGYTIRRIIGPGEPVDPCAPLEFFPPKGSDQLHEALKNAFPFEPTLQARMRQAVINFHLSEAQADIAQADFIQDDYLPSPQSSFISSATSPSRPGPLLQARSKSRDACNPPAQEELMDVWCLPSQPAAKIHTRRNMTAEEKKAYKAKRLAGACADCKRRRRKCDHDPSNPTKATSKKAVKTRMRSSVAKAPAIKTRVATSQSFPVPQAVQDPFTFTPQETFFSSDGGFTNSMGYDIPISMGFDNSFGNDVGFDLKNDFDLFPDSATNTGRSSTGMDAADWLAGNSPGTLSFDQQLNAPSHDFNNWPMDPIQKYNTFGDPLTPQSLSSRSFSPQSLIMSRSQSGHSSSSNLLSLVLANTNLTSSNQPAFYQNAGDFGQAAPQSLLVSSNNGSRSSRHLSSGSALPGQQFIPTCSPQNILESPTISFRPGTSSGSCSSPEFRPLSSYVVRGFLNQDRTDHVTGSTAKLERSDQHTSRTASSKNGLSSASSSTTAGNRQSTSASSSEDECSRTRSTDLGRTLPPDLGGVDGDALLRRPSTAWSPTATASVPEQQSYTRFVRPSTLARQDTRIKATSRGVSVAGSLVRRPTSMAARNVSVHHLQPLSDEVVQSSGPTGQAGRVKNANRAAMDPNYSKRRSIGLPTDHVIVDRSATDVEEFDCHASGLGSSRGKGAKVTFIDHSLGANVQLILPARRISHTGYPETSDHHLDMSKLCRLKHSSAAADDVCSALQSSFDLPPLGDPLSRPSLPLVNMYQWLVLFLITILDMFGFAPPFSSGSGKSVKSKKCLEFVADSDCFTSKGTLAKVPKFDDSTRPANSQLQLRSDQQALKHSSVWKLCPGRTQRFVCRLSYRVRKMQSEGSRIHQDI